MSSPPRKGDRKRSSYDRLQEMRTRACRGTKGRPAGLGTVVAGIIFTGRSLVALNVDDAPRSLARREWWRFAR